MIKKIILIKIEIERERQRKRIWRKGDIEKDRQIDIEIERERMRTIERETIEILKEKHTVIN